MTEPKKPISKKNVSAKKPKPPVAPKMEAPKAEVKKPDVEPVAPVPFKEQKTEVVKQPEPPKVKSVLPKNEGHPPSDPGPDMTPDEVVAACGITQTLYGGGRLKNRLRTRRSRYE